MESDLLRDLNVVTQLLFLPSPVDLREELKRNPKGKKWAKRPAKKLKGMIWHQELGWNSVEAVAKYHTSNRYHLIKSGAETIGYTFAIRRDGQIVLCNDIDRAAGSKEIKGKKLDEIGDYVTVLFEGLFNGKGVSDEKAGEPKDSQILAGMILWQVCKNIWKWKEEGLKGHHLFGNASCPGKTLERLVNAVRFKEGEKKKDNKFKNIRNRQIALADLLYYEGKVDGVWGPQCEKSLKIFQKSNGLEPDGVWGPKTEDKIVKVLKKLTTVR